MSDYRQQQEQEHERLARTLDTLTRTLRGYQTRDDVLFLARELGVLEHFTAGKPARSTH